MNNASDTRAFSKTSVANGLLVVLAILLLSNVLIGENGKFWKGLQDQIVTVDISDESDTNDTDVAVDALDAEIVLLKETKPFTDPSGLSSHTPRDARNIRAPPSLI